MKLGCLSGIAVGRGTNRQLNTILKSNRYGPEISSALTTCTLFEHNEKFSAKFENRQCNPINAYDDTVQSSNEHDER